MKNISTRTRIITSTLILTMLFMSLQGVDIRGSLNLNLNFDPIKPFFLAIVTYFLTYWVVHFRISAERMVTVLGFPALSIFALMLLAEFLITTVFSNLGVILLFIFSAVVFSSITYVIFLTVNILNISQEKKVPLGQAARASQFVLTMLIAYISYFLLFSNDIQIILKFILIAVITFLLVFFSMSTTLLRSKQRYMTIYIVFLAILFTASVIAIWPITAPYSALVLTIVLYILLGTALEVREIISNWIWIEYFGLYLLVFLLLILVAEWGINGTLI